MCTVSLEYTDEGEAPARLQFFTPTFYRRIEKMVFVFCVFGFRLVCSVYTLCYKYLAEW